MFITWALLVGAGIVIILAWTFGRAVFNVAKGEKVVCPSCGNEILKSGTAFNCIKCNSKIIIHKDGTPIKG